MCDTLVTEVVRNLMDLRTTVNLHELQNNVDDASVLKWPDTIDISLYFHQSGLPMRHIVLVWKHEELADWLLKSRVQAEMLARCLKHYIRKQILRRNLTQESLKPNLVKLLNSVAGGGNDHQVWICFAKALNDRFGMSKFLIDDLKISEEMLKNLPTSENMTKDEQILKNWAPLIQMEKQLELKFLDDLQSAGRYEEVDIISHDPTMQTKLKSMLNDVSEIKLRVIEGPRFSRRSATRRSVTINKRQARTRTRTEVKSDEMQTIIGAFRSKILSLRESIENLNVQKDKLRISICNEFTKNFQVKNFAGSTVRIYAREAISINKQNQILKKATEESNSILTRIKEYLKYPDQSLESFRSWVQTHLERIRISLRGRLAASQRMSGRMKLSHLLHSSVWWMHLWKMQSSGPIGKKTLVKLCPYLNFGRLRTQKIDSKVLNHPAKFSPIRQAFTRHLSLILSRSLDDTGIEIGSRCWNKLFAWQFQQHFVEIQIEDLPAENFVRPRFKRMVPFLIDMHTSVIYLSGFFLYIDCSGVQQSRNTAGKHRQAHAK